MKQKSETITLVITTVCILLLNLSNLVEYLDIGYIGSTVSNVCFLAGDIFLAIAWIVYFVKKKKSQ